jgi:RNA polymerase sigma factor (sigma-70 family)
MLNKEDKFTSLYLPLEKRLQRYCEALTKNKEDAQDLMQETSIVCLKNIEKLKTNQAFESYFFLSAKRLNYRKYKEKRHKYKFEIEADDTLPDINWRHNNRIVFKELFFNLLLLPFDSYMLFVYYYFLGFSLKEISDSKKIDINTLKVRLHRLRKKLTKIIGNEDIGYVEKYFKMFKNRKYDETESQSKIKFIIYWGILKDFSIVD